MQSQPKQLSDALHVIIEHAQRETAQRHGNYIDVEHLLLGLLRHRSGSAYDLLAQRGIDVNALYDQVAASVGMERPTPAPVKDYSKWARAALDRATQEAGSAGQSTLGSGHLLLALMGETDGAVHDALSPLSLSPEDVRAYLSQHSERAASAPLPAFAQASASGSSKNQEQPSEIVLVPFRPKSAHKKKLDAAVTARWGNWPWIVLALLLLIAYLAFILPGNSLFTFAIVIIGWVFSVTLHEFSHALVAYYGGDYTVKDKGYLSFNPLKYTHPMLSIGMPLLFLALGGIGLPGGAVYIESHRLKNKWWGAAVSAAGPTANLLLALVLAAPFALGLVNTDVIQFKIWLGQTNQAGTIWENSTVWSAVAFLTMLQVTSVFFNLIPIPPLDGFGIIEPFLDERTRSQLRVVGMYGLFLIFLLMWVDTPIRDAFWNAVFDVTRSLHLPNNLVNEGYRNFMFWRESPH